MGWYIPNWQPWSNGTSVDSNTVMPNNNIILQARWQLTTTIRTITLNPTGGSVNPRTQTAIQGQNIGALPTPTRANFTFTDWHTSRTNATTANRVRSNTTMPTNNLTIYAHWNPITHTITWNAGFGIFGINNPSRWNHQQGSPLGTLPTITRANYTFDGWWTSATGGTRISSTTRMPSNNVTYFARWTPNNNVLTFNPNGGSALNPNTRTVQEGDRLGTLDTPIREHHRFIGWYDARIGGTRVQASTRMPAGNLTIFARWEPIMRTITWNAGSSVTNPQSWSRQQGTQLSTALPTVTRTNYTFDGWWTSATGGTRVNTTTQVPSNNVTYFARWIANRTVTFNSNGGSAVNPATRTVVQGRTIGTLPTPTRTNYTFDGWFTTATGGNRVTANTVVQNNMTVFARWSPIMRTIVWNAGAGVTNPTSQSLQQGSTIGILPTVSRVGYTFDGWWTAANGGTRINTSTRVPNNNVTYFARWQRVQTPAPTPPQTPPQTPPPIQPSPLPPGNFQDSTIRPIESGWIWWDGGEFRNPARADHHGIDMLPYPVQTNVPIVAIADGRVIRIIRGFVSTTPNNRTCLHDGCGGWGNYIVIQHNIDGQMVTSLYSHMHEIDENIYEEMLVTQGRVLGTVGNSGFVDSRGHLHFEIGINGHGRGFQVNPRNWINLPQTGTPWRSFEN